MESKNSKICVIGAGRWGKNHIKTLNNLGCLGGIVEQNQKVLSEFSKTYPDVKTFSDTKNAIKADFDGFVVATPAETHFNITEYLLKSKKNVLVEKPLALNSKDAIKLKNLAKENQVNLMVGHVLLFHPAFHKIKVLIDDGKIGDVYHIHHQGVSRRTFIEYNSAGAWAHQKNLAGGGPFFDWGVYDLSFHLGLLNDVPQIASVNSFTRNGLKVFKDKKFVSDIEEHGAACLEFDTGLTYYYERGSGVQAEVPHETRIYGTKGSLRFGFCSWDPVEMDYYYMDENGDEQHEVLTIENPDDHDDNLEMAHHFLDVLIENVKPQMTVELAAKHLHILFRILDA